MSAGRNAVRSGAPLYWASINMRAGLVVISPIITLIGSDLGLSTIPLAWLTSIPVICFAFSASVSTILRRHFSVNRIITGALWLLGASLLLRAAGSVAALYIFTVGVGFGIAILNVMLPIWVKQNATTYSGLLTGIYVAVMSVTTSIAIALATPLAHLGSAGWQLALAPWGVVAIVSAAWWHRYTRATPEQPPSEPAAINIRMFLHSKLAWQITMVFGLQSMNAYASRAWLPTVMLGKGFTMATAGSTVALAGLLGALGAMAVPHIAQRMTDQRPTIWFISLLCAASFVGVLYGSHAWVVFWVCMSQVGQWCSYPLALLLIILRSPNADQAQSLSAMVQSIGYCMGALSPLIAGSLFELTGQWSATLWVLTGIAIAQAFAGHSAGRIGHVRRRGISEEELLVSEAGTA